MSGPSSSVSGISSGIQWQAMIDQIMTAEQSSKLDPITAAQTKDQARLAAWQSYSDVVSKLSAAANTLRDATAFNTFSVTAGSSPTTGRSLVTATATTGAVAANYQIEVQDIARAEKLGSSPVADTTAAMNLTGDALVGGKKLSIVATDSLAGIRDKINALNTGAGASHVSASILSVSSGVNRLVLTSDVTGSAGIELTENGGSSVFSSLGLVSSTFVANTIDADTRSFGFGASGTSLAQMLGATMPASGNINVNGIPVGIDLSQDSLTAIAAKINAAVGPDMAKVASEMVNGSAVYRLLVTGAVTAGADVPPGAAAISTQTLQQVGFLKNDRSVAMRLLVPTDAKLKIDGIAITRSTNTISDALAGVTLAVQQAELNATVNVTVGRDSSAAVTAVKAYAAAYNGVASFVATNTASKGPLAFDSAIRSTLRQLKSAIFNPVVGLQNTTYTSGPTVGLALDKAGKLQVDETMLTAALAANPGEVKALFSTSGSSTLSTMQYMSTSSKTQPGTYAVAVTQAATNPTGTGSVLAGAYNNAAVANTMKVSDSFSGKTSTITLVDADTAATIAAKLNVAFGNDGLRLGASIVGGNQLQITGTQFGSASTFTTAFELSGVAAAAQLGFGASPYAGIDVAGTINGKAATGAGRLLTASPPAIGDTNSAEGLAVLYTGLTPPESATVSYVLGIGGMMFNASNPLTQSGDGQIQTQENSIQSKIDSTTTRAATVQGRLDQQRASLTKQFTAMEVALSKLQAQASALTSQLNSLQQPSK